jgi:RsiW-degrading membrane proteinase PrsW (M82 family)
MPPEDSVFDEPAYSPEVSGPPPPGADTYASRVERGLRQTTRFESWSWTLLLAAASGPWAVLGALWGSGESAFSALALVLVGPLVEESMKIAAAMAAVETRPWRFRSAGQLLVCAVAGGLAFAALENLLYLNVYVPNPPEWLIRWRWTVCVALHAGCSTVAGLGMIRVWRRAVEKRVPPRMSDAAPYLTAAVLIHGTYNAAALFVR